MNSLLYRCGNVRVKGSRRGDYLVAFGWIEEKGGNLGVGSGGRGGRGFGFVGKMIFVFKVRMG